MGQGAAQAIEDACALGAIMPLGTTPEKVSSRLVLWEQCRKDRAAKIVLHTRHRSRKADGSQGPPQTRELCIFLGYLSSSAQIYAEKQFGPPQSTSLTRQFRIVSITMPTSTPRSS